jgi:hypothetical protein
MQKAHRELLEEARAARKSAREFADQINNRAPLPPPGAHVRRQEVRPPPRKSVAGYFTPIEKSKIVEGDDADKD